MSRSCFEPVERLAEAGSRLDRVVRAGRHSFGTVVGLVGGLEEGGLGGGGVGGDLGGRGVDLSV